MPSPQRCTGVALCLYLNTLSADFAYDDSRAIVKNPDLLPETPLTNLVYDDFWGTPLTHSGSHKSYRPLCVLTFRFNYYLGGLDPFGYHLGNVLCHALTTWVFTHLTRRVLAHTFPTLVAGLLFAAHPIHTEAVAGIVGRADVLACLFYLLTLLSYMQYAALRDGKARSARSGKCGSWEESGSKSVADERRGFTEEKRGGGHDVKRGGDGKGCADERRGLRWVWMGLVVTFTAASMLTKEQAVAVLAACATYDVFIRHKTSVRDVFNFSVITASHYRRLLEGLLCLFACGASLVGFRLYFMGNKPPEFAPSDNPASDSDSLLTRTLTYNYLPSLNFWLLLFPYTLSFDWSMEAIPLVESVSDFRNVATVVFYCCLAYVGMHVVRSLERQSKGGVTKPHANGNGVHIHSQRSPSHQPSTTTVLRSHSKDNHRRGSNSSTDSLDASSSSPKLSSRTLNTLIIASSVIVFPFIPASNLFFYVGFVIAERILYIPSMGVCLLIAQGAYVLYLAALEQWKKKGVVLTLVVIIVLFGARTWRRNQDWQTEEKLYSSGIAVNPAKAWGNLANVLNDKGLETDAEEAYRNALNHRGNMADVHYNLGILLQNQGRIEEAIESYKRAIHFRPKLTVAHLNLGILTAQTGNQEAAAQCYRHCADLDTSGLKDPRLHESTKISCLYNLGRLYADQNMFKEAEETYHEALRRRPPHYPAQSIQNMLGELYMKINNPEQAEHWYHEALKSKPDHIPAHLTLAKLFQHKGVDDAAVRWFDKARAIDPSDGTIDHHHAQLYVSRGKHLEAAEMYKTAIEKNPNDFDVIFSAANAFRQINDKDSAENLYRRAAQIRPKEPTAHMNLGAMLHMNGKLEEAEVSYLTALQLKPTDTITQDNLQKLRNLMATKGGSAR